jgi:AraC-like DNA-binding protein
VAEIGAVIYVLRQDGWCLVVEKLVVNGKSELILFVTFRPAAVPAGAGIFRTMKELPVHSLFKDDAAIKVLELQHKNPYDFTREHRHTYFEIIFFENGGGYQLIDFTEREVKSHSCYIVFPLQVHLLRRAPKSNGTVLQFREEVLSPARVRNILQLNSFGENSPVLFENDKKKMKELGPLIDLLEKTCKDHSANSGEIAFHYLQALLLNLAGNRKQNEESKLGSDDHLLFSFQNLLEQHYPENHSVQFYAKLMSVTEKKLSALTKKHLGLSPLQVIHNRILLEAKRILLFEDTSHKEIAFRLGFDSPASFSQFIKNKTGSNPSELHVQLVNIHK